MRARTCDECGQGFTVDAAKGRLPARCQPCTASYRNRLSDLRRRKRRSGLAPGSVICVDCGLVLEWNGRGRPKDRCDPCRVVHNRRTSSMRSLAWIEANPEKAKEKQRQGYERNADVLRARSLAAHYKSKYGITIADRDLMLDLHGGKCAICVGRPNGKGAHARLHVDHCHATNRIRGLLCSNCNTLLGLAGDNATVLAAAIKYLNTT